MRFKNTPWLSALLLAAGLSALPVLLFSLPVPVYIPLLAASASSLSAALTAERKRFWAAPALWMLLCAATLLLARDGVAPLLDSLLTAWQQLHPRIYPAYAAADSAAPPAAVAAALASLLGLWSAAYARRPRPVWFWTASLLLSLLLLTFSPTASPWQLVLGALVLLLLYAIRFGRRGSTAAVRVWCRAALLLLAAAVVLTALGDTARPAPLTSLQQHLSRTVQEIRCGSNDDAGLTDGDLTSAGTRRQSEDAMLRVTMSQPGSYYLRGFVGEVYDGSRWLPQTNATLSANADTFYWLHHDGFYGQAQIVGAAQSAAPEVLHGENRITVTNAAASSRYLYAPYETMPTSPTLDAAAIGDAAQYAPGLRGQRSYTVLAANNIIVQYQRIAAGLTSDAVLPSAFLQTEGAYNRYVYTVDTALPPELDSFLREKLGAYTVEDGQRHFDYQKAKQNILFYLSTYATFSESVSPVPPGVDFVLSFLDGAQTGYDVHYASAAAMMFRYYGIPARYAEGFLVTKDDASRLQPGETLTLNGTSGHAWVEYYQDGVGWLPFEVTPGYLSAMEQAETYRSISGLVGHSSRAQESENLDAPQQEDEEPSLLSFWLKYRLKILLFLSVLAAVVLLCLFVLWLAWQRKKTARRKAAFLSDDIPRAIRTIYLYTMDVLLSQGLPLRNCSPADYAQDIDEDLRQEYLSVVSLWEEAKFSGHPMEESQRQRALRLKDEVWTRTWRVSGPLRRIRLKYVLFL